MSLESDIKKILSLRSKSFTLQCEANTKFKELRDKIKDGETTGDRITDFVIENVGVLSENNEKPYREFLYINSHKAEREYYDMSK